MNETRSTTHTSHPAIGTPCLIAALIVVAVPVGVVVFCSATGVELGLIANLSFAAGFFIWAVMLIAAYAIARAGCSRGNDGKKGKDA